MNNSKFKRIKMLFLLFIFIMPLLIAIKFISLSNEEIISRALINSINISICLDSFILAIFVIYFEKKKIKVMSFGKSLAFTLFFIALSLELGSVVQLVFYDKEFRDWLVKTSISSINYKNVATSLYSEETINNVIDEQTKKVDFGQDVIDYDVNYERKILYKNKFDEDIATHEEGEIYKIVKVEGTTIGANYHYEGYMAIVYDPSKVKLAKSVGAGTQPGSYGQVLTTISKNNNALVAMNAGGFYDPYWNSNGGIPHGDVIIDGVLDSSYTRGTEDGGLVAFTYDNELVLKRMTGEEAIEMGVRDAVDWGPFLIVDGVNKFGNVTRYTWACGRTAIGQRADGIVLMLVVDGLQAHSKGVSYADLAKIMADYGAVNAANMDGGTSTMMVENHKYINSPWNGYVPTFRRLPNAWIVTE